MYNSVNNTYNWREHNLPARMALKRQSCSKSASAVKLLGINIPDFIQYISSKFKEGMSWDRRLEFHLDHIRPCASFDLSDPEQVKECFHFTNYQPLWARENMSKNAKWNNHDYNIRNKKYASV